MLFQTSNLIINLDHDDWILAEGDKTLVEVGFGGCIFTDSRYFFRRNILIRERNRS